MVTDSLHKLLAAEQTADTPPAAPVAAEREARLWDAFRAGSEEAFAQIYREHAKVLLTYGKKMTPHARLAEDCLHDLFIELWNRRQFLNPTTSVRLYLLKALKHKMLRAVANQNRLPLAESPEEDHLEFEFSYEAELINRQLSAEQEERLRASVSQLTKSQREIIFLRFYSGLSYEQIGEVMGIHYQSVKNLMFRALQALRQQLISALLLLPAFLVL